MKDLKLMLIGCEYANADDMLIDAITAGVREKHVQEIGSTDQGRHKM